MENGKVVLTLPVTAVYGWTRDTESLQKCLMAVNSDEISGYGEKGIGIEKWESLYSDMMEIMHISNKFFDKMFLSNYTKWKVEGLPFYAENTDIDEFADKNGITFDHTVFYPAYYEDIPVLCVKVVFEQEYE